MSSFLNSFTYNNISIITSSYKPVGTIMLHLGTSDPNGWIICDGITRTSTDNRYADLATLLNSTNNVTTNNSNSVTPPNLIDRFLLGANSTNKSTTGGRSSVTLNVNNLPSHNHTITISDPGHDHSIPIEAGGMNNLSNSASDIWGTRGGWYDESTTRGTNSSKTGITATASSTGNTTAFDILPPYYTLNFIIKY